MRRRRTASFRVTEWGNSSLCSGRREAGAMGGTGEWTGWGGERLWRGWGRGWRFWVVVLAAVLMMAPAAHASDDTARFYGTWQAHILVNGQLYTVISIHDESGYRNFVRSPSGDTPAGEGSFSA